LPGSYPGACEIRSFGFNFGTQITSILTPENLSTWTTFIGILLLAVTVALMAAATVAARRGLLNAPGVASDPARVRPEGV
jgi:hypothetical protein